jgi:hypothetical protein
LNPDGHFGFTAFTFLVVLPLMQMIEVFLAATGLVTAGAVGVAEGVGVATGAGTS